MEIKVIRMSSSFSRYNRQELIRGWDQRRIEKSSVALIGSDLLAGCTSLLLTSLGVGTLEIYDNDLVNIYGKNLFFEADENEPKVEAMERTLKKINPYADISGVNCLPDRHFLAGIIGHPDVIMELTNNTESKKVCLSYGKKLGIPVITGSADDVSGRFYFTRGYDDRSLLLEDYAGKKQGVMPSEILSGVVVENFRKHMAPLSKDEQTIKSMSYNLNSRARFTEAKAGNRANDSDPNVFSKKHATMIGAGALGNFIGIGLALMGVGRLDIIDGDHIEETNLNRQPLFYNSVGQMKAAVLAKRLNKINTDMDARSMARFLDENFEPYFKANKPDIIIDSVDNLSARAIINHYAVEHKIPLVSGGTGPSSGQVMSYIPGKSACLDCRMNVDKEMVEERTVHSCIRDPMPSVVMSNEIVGGIILGEMATTLSPEIYGENVSGIIKYDSSRSNWAGVIGSVEKCDCKRGDVKDWMKEVMEKYKT